MASIIPTITFYKFPISEVHSEPLLQYRSLFSKKRFISLIVNVDNLIELKKLSYIGVDCVIKSKHENNWIAIVMIHKSAINKFENLCFVRGICASRKIKLSILQPMGATSNGLLGLVGFGININQKCFIYQNKTKFDFIWHQKGQSNHRSPYGYGQLFVHKKINSALQGALQEPALALDEYEMDTSEEEIPTKERIGYVHCGGANPSFLSVIEGVKFIFDWSDLPCVVHLKVASRLGPHDGTHLFDQALDSLVVEKSNRSMVITRKKNAVDISSGSLFEGKSIDILWEMELTLNKHVVEIWYPGSDRCDLELFSPSGDLLCRVGYGEKGYLKNKEGDCIAFISSMKSKLNGENQIFIKKRKSDSLKGIYKIKLTPTSVEKDEKEHVWHAWIENMIGDSTIKKVDSTSPSAAAASID